MEEKKTEDKVKIEDMQGISPEDREAILALKNQKSGSGIGKKLIIAMVITAVVMAIVAVMIKITL